MIRPSFFSRAFTRSTWAQRRVFSSGVRKTSLPSSFFAGIKAQCLGFEIKLPTFKGEHLALSAPAVGVGDRRGYLEIIRQVFPHGGELLALEEALAGSSLLQLANDGHPRHMSVLQRQPERARQDAQLAVDGAVRSPLRLAVLDVPTDHRRVDLGRAGAAEEGVEMLQALLHLDQIAALGVSVVLLQILDQLLVPLLVR